MSCDIKPQHEHFISGHDGCLLLLKASNWPTGQHGKVRKAMISSVFNACMGIYFLPAINICDSY
jgi:hypothetical protein